MKKFLTLIVMAVFALCANAQDRTVTGYYNSYSSDYTNYTNAAWGLNEGMKMTIDYYGDNLLVIRNFVNKGFDIYVNYDPATGDVINVGNFASEKNTWVYTDDSYTNYFWVDCTDLYGSTYSWVSDENIFLNLYDNQWRNYNINFVKAPSPKYYTARVYKTLTEGETTYTNWPGLPYKLEADGEYFTTTVKVTADNAFTVLDWEGNGDESNSLALTFDANKTSGNGKTINGENVDRRWGNWVTTESIYDDGYYGLYFYAASSKSNIYMNDENGGMRLRFYSYTDWAYMHYILDWKMDNSYSGVLVTPTVYSKINKLDKVTFRFLNATWAFPNNTTGGVTMNDYATITNDEGEVVCNAEVLWGNDFEYGNLNLIDVKCDPITEPGEYTVTIPAGAVTLDGVANTEAYTATFTVVAAETPSSDATAINAVNAAETTVKAGKFVEQNKVVIYKNGKKYNAAGAQIK